MIELINNLIKKKSILKRENELKLIDISKLNMNIQEERNISYIDDLKEEHKLDIYYKNKKELKPILIDLHGGGFISGSKDLNRLFGNTMASKGYLVFNLNYRLAYPKISVFDQVEDISMALNWILKHIKEYNGDIHNLYLSAHSSSCVLAIIESLLCESKKMQEHFQIIKRNYHYQGLFLDCGFFSFYNIFYYGLRRMIFPKNYKLDKRYQDMKFNQNKELNLLPKVFLLTTKYDKTKSMVKQFQKILIKNKINYKLRINSLGKHVDILFNPTSEENIRVMEELHKYFLGLNKSDE